ncbi:MAG TPA: nitroreductase family protein [Erysipelotrichaceae bacterium]|nr:nitroreductase family protein [Erysipelotrichaceae bacterium]
MTNDFKSIVLERRSIREYDPSVKISKEEMSSILHDATRAPSSVNLQPWRFVIVESEEGKEKLKPFMRFNTKQNDTSAAMILIFGDMECYRYAETIYDQAVKDGHMPREVRDKQVSNIVPLYQSLSREKMNDIVKVDSSLMAMQLMLVARSYGYDTNPIGGYYEEKLAETFGLDSNRYVSVLIISIGKALETGYSSLRLPVETVATWK